MSTISHLVGFITRFRWQNIDLASYSKIDGRVAGLLCSKQGHINLPLCLEFLD